MHNVHELFIVTRNLPHAQRFRGRGEMLVDLKKSEYFEMNIELQCVTFFGMYGVAISSNS